MLHHHMELIKTDDMKIFRTFRQIIYFLLIIGFDEMYLYYRMFFSWTFV